MFPTCPDQVRARKNPVTELVIAELQHEAIEKRYFRPMVWEALADGEELADRAIQQEGEAKPPPGRAEPVWPKVLATLDKRSRVELGEKMAEAKQTAPTWPHPNGPSRPGLLKAVATADKLGDALTGHGHR
jgi:hypothetical protein